MILPKRFLKWAYFERVKFVKSFLRGGFFMNERALIESTRHTPALCTARLTDDGKIFVNAKIVGAGFVPKEKFLDYAIEDFRRHVYSGGNLSLREYAIRGVKLLLKHVYFEDEEEAYRRMDFSKISTLELAKDVPHSSKHTWTNLQSCRSACLLYYMPPSISFELHGTIEIHLDGSYFEFVNLAHDIFHYTPASKRVERPCLIFNVESVYDNSPNRNAFGLLLNEETGFL